MYWGGMSWVSCSRDTDWLHLLATPPILHYCTAFPVVHWASAVVMLPHGPVRSECCPSLSLLLMPLLLACVKYRSNGLHAVRQLCLIQSDWPMAWGIRERWETACRWRWQLVLEDIHGMTHGKAQLLQANTAFNLSSGCVWRDQNMLRDSGEQKALL